MAPRDRRRLRDESFTIVSSDCWGAEVYRHLDLPYKTPFVGLYVMAPCFLRIAEDLRGYLESPLGFASRSRYDQAERERSGLDNPYPIGLLGGDAELHFVHYGSEEDAQAKWERRVGRIDWERIFLKLSADKDLCSSAVLERFDRLSHPNKVAFAARRYPTVRSAVRIPGYIKDGAKLFPISLLRFDVVRWLNNEPALRF